MSRPDPRALSLVDEVAERVISMAAPFELRIAETPAELEAVYRLRCEVAIAEGWATQRDFPDGLERDAHDAGAEQITAWSGDELAASQRIVYPVLPEPLPTEKAFGLRLEAGGEVVDIGRTAMASGFRGDRRHLLLTALLARSWQAFRARGFHLALGIVDERIIRIYDRIGLHVERLGPAREWWGEPRYPALFDTAREADRLAELWEMAPAGSGRER